MRTMSGMWLNESPVGTPRNSRFQREHKENEVAGPHSPCPKIVPSTRVAPAEGPATRWPPRRHPGRCGHGVLIAVSDRYG
ncbi:MAG: hypothetical protein V8T86_11505 [Victivallis sp.]